jgi:hypothetical protein
MVNPGGEMSTDMIVPGLPSRRLMFAAINNGSAAIVYEHGGFVGTVRAAIFDFTNQTDSVTGLNSNVRDLQDLRKALTHRQPSLRQPKGFGVLNSWLCRLKNGRHMQ